QGRGEDLLQEGGLAVRRRAERPQVAPADPVACELGDGPDDLPLGLVVVLHPRADLALDHAVLLELGDQAGLRPGLLAHVLERVQRAAVADADARAPAPT